MKRKAREELARRAEKKARKPGQGNVGRVPDGPKSDRPLKAGPQGLMAAMFALAFRRMK